MDGPNKNPSDQPDKVKLIFDVMPQGAGSAEIPPEPVRSMDLPPPPSAPSLPSKAMPEMPEAIIPKVAAGASEQLAEKGRWHARLPRFDRKWLIIIAVVALLGAGGYFGYRYYSNSQKPSEGDISSKKSGTQDSAKMPDEWLKKYFGKADCDPALCGPTADPDKDGLANSQEQKYSTDPQNPDSDYDGLSDSDEAQVYNTDPRVADTDGDGFEDGVEVRNGYSPTIGGPDRISNVEKQVIADNTDKYGQHEPTQTFLSLETFKPLFSDVTSTSPFVVSVPKGGTFEAQINTVRLLYNATSSVNFVSAAAGSEMVSYLNAAWTIPSGEGAEIAVSQRKVGGLDLRLDENTRGVGQAGEGMHALRAIFQKNDRIYQVYYLVPESKWAESKLLAQTIINSIR